MNSSKVNHKGIDRILVEFPFDKLVVEKLRQIPDTKWSKTLKAWHIPYTKESFALLKTKFPEIIYKKKEQANGLSRQVEIAEIDLNKNEKSIKLVVTTRIISIFLPKNEKDISYIRSLNYSRWNKSQFCWVVPNFGTNFENLKNYFGQRIDDILEINTEPIKLNNTTDYHRKSNEVLAIKTSSNRLDILLGYDIETVAKIKQLPNIKYNSQSKRWSLPFSDKYLAEIKAIAQTKFTFNYIEEKPITGKPVPSLYPKLRNCPVEYTLKLKEMRYAESTLKTYTGAFEEFINYYPSHELDNISEQMIIDYIRYLVLDRTVSASVQNQAINAIKFYYEKVAGGKRTFYFIDRPLKEKTLPMVLNIEEVKKILLN